MSSVNPSQRSKSSKRSRRTAPPSIAHPKPSGGPSLSSGPLLSAQSKPESTVQQSRQQHRSRHHGSSIPNETVRIPRRGVFHASELIQSEDAAQWESENFDMERACIIRFPPEIAAILRERLATQLSIELNEEGDGRQDCDENGAGEYAASESSVTRSLGLTITPTPKEDYRIFDVEVELQLGVPSSAKQFRGILVELPCILEAYKSFEGDLLFKSNDISQMLYVFDVEDEASFDMKKIRDEQLWEWHAGLTPATHRIRRRKFKNFGVFDKVDVSIRERELLDVSTLGLKAHYN